MNISRNDSETVALVDDAVQLLSVTSLEPVFVIQKYRRGVVGTNSREGMPSEVLATDLWPKVVPPSVASGENSQSRRN